MHKHDAMGCGPTWAFLASTWFKVGLLLLLIIRNVLSILTVLFNMGVLIFLSVYVYGYKLMDICWWLCVQRRDIIIPRDIHKKDRYW